MTESKNTVKTDIKDEKPVREPAFHIVKRDKMPFAKSFTVRLIAILASLIFSGIITIFLTKDNPISIYVTMFNGAFGMMPRVWVTLQQTVMLLGVSLAVTLAFKMRFWNCGAEGQVLIGGLAAAMCMFFIKDSIPEWLLIVTMIVASLAAGAIWGLIPAVFKANWGTNETLFTLMMNYVAIQAIEIFLKIADKSGSNTVGPSLLKFGHFPTLLGQQYLLNIVIVAVLTFVVAVYLKRTKHGYEISVVGESENTARYVGINVKKVIIRTMAISGALGGLIGLLLVGGTSHSIDSNISAGRGFTAIMVSWLSKFNPYVMALVSLMLVVIQRGAEEVSTKFGLNLSFADIITGIILFFIIGSEFFIQYKISLNKNNKLIAKFTNEKEVA